MKKENRTYRMYLEDMNLAMERIATYIRGYSFAKFKQDHKTTYFESSIKFSKLDRFFLKNCISSLVGFVNSSVLLFGVFIGVSKNPEILFTY